MADFQICIDARDVNLLSRFWAEALGYVLQPPPPGFASWDEFAAQHDIPTGVDQPMAAIIDPHGGGPRILFQKVPEAKTGKNRIHLDVDVVGGPEAAEIDRDERWARVAPAVDRLVAAGAAEVEARSGMAGERWVVCTDPEGNEFCVH